MQQPPAIPAASRPAPVNPFYNNGSLQPQPSTQAQPSESSVASNPFDVEPPPYIPAQTQTQTQGGPMSYGVGQSQSYAAAPATGPPALPSRNRLSPHNTGNPVDRAPSPRRTVPPLPQGGMMHAAPPLPPSRTSVSHVAPPPAQTNQGLPQLPARLNTLVSSVATAERKKQATQTFDRAQEGFGRVVTRERQDMAWRGVQKVGEGVVGLVGKIKGPERK